MGFDNGHGVRHGHGQDLSRGLGLGPDQSHNVSHCIDHNLGDDLRHRVGHNLSHATTSFSAMTMTSIKVSATRPRPRSWPEPGGRDNEGTEATCPRTGAASAPR